MFNDTSNRIPSKSYQFTAGTTAETTISSEVRNSYPTVLVSTSHLSTQINPGTSQNTILSNEKRNNIYDANGELLNHPFNIVNTDATRNIAHNTEDQIAGSSQSWQNLIQQQLLGYHLVRNEVKNNIEPRHFVQPYRIKTINDCNSATVNQLLGLPKSDKKYTADHLQLNHRPPARTIYNNNNNCQNEISQLPGSTFAMFNDTSNRNLSKSYQFTAGTTAETTISSEVRNSYPTVLVSTSHLSTQINPGTSQNTILSNEKRNNIYDANGELLNHPFNIVNTDATRNIAHNTEDQIAGSSQSWQNLLQQQLLGDHLVRNEVKNNIEPRHFVQPYRIKTINDCNSATVN